MANSVPSTFEPLASSNPVPADTDAMTSLGKQYTSTAAEIATQASNLQQLSDSSAEAWKSKAGSVFTSKASDLSTRITQAEKRYSTAGAALTNAAEPMYQAQQQAYAAVEQAQDAQQTMTANAPGPKPAPGSPPPTAAQQQAASTAASNYSAASDSLAAARASFNSAVDAYHTAASAAAKTINDELSHDALKDSWWEDHMGWLTEFFKILAYIVMALAVIALIIVCPGFAGLAALVGISGSALATAGTVIGYTLLAATVLQTIYDGATHNWKSLGLDILGLVTFGIGAGAEKLGDSVVESAADAAKDAASKSATDALANAGSDEAGNAIKNAAMDAASDKASAAASKEFTDLRTGHNDWVAANPGDAGPAAFVFSPQGIEAGAKAAGEEAANDVLGDANAVSQAYGEAAAGKVQSALDGAAAGGVVGNLTAAVSVSKNIADDLAKLNAINGAMSGVGKVGTAINKLTAASGVDGAFQLGAFGATIYGTYGAATGG